MTSSSHSASADGSRQRPRRGRWIFAALLIIPLLEIATIILVGQAVGPWWTFGALIGLSVIGAWLVHREGRRTWQRLREALRQGQPPAREVTDAGLVLVGGAMLLTPGFLTDAVGLFFVLPFTRPLTRIWLQTVVAGKLLSQRGPAGTGGGGFSAGRPARSTGADVIEGEIVNDEDGPHSGERAR